MVPKRTNVLPMFPADLLGQKSGTGKHISWQGTHPMTELCRRIFPPAILLHVSAVGELVKWSKALWAVELKIVQVAEIEVLEVTGPWPRGPLLAVPPSARRSTEGSQEWWRLWLAAALKTPPIHICALEARTFRCMATAVSSCPCFPLLLARASASLPLPGCPDVLLNQMPNLQKKKKLPLCVCVYACLMCVRECVCVSVWDCVCVFTPHFTIYISLYINQAQLWC